MARAIEHLQADGAKVHLGPLGGELGGGAMSSGCASAAGSPLRQALQGNHIRCGIPQDDLGGDPFAGQVTDLAGAASGALAPAAGSRGPREAVSAIGSEGALRADDGERHGGSGSVIRSMALAPGHGLERDQHRR